MGDGRFSSFNDTLYVTNLARSSFANGYGNITFLEPITIKVTTDVDSVITIASNSLGVDVVDELGFNVSSLISLYGLESLVQIFMD